MSKSNRSCSISPAKDAISQKIREALASVSGICSITFVGSLVDREDLSGIGDIDTVILFDSLTPERFRDAAEKVGALTGSDLGFDDRRVFVNTKLGPLKYNTTEQVVVHLMMYDNPSHREHVLRSPFTCLDWERSQLVFGARLEDVYPAGRLSIRDFIESRRGLLAYFEDLESGVVRCRRFEESAGRMVEVPESVVLTRRSRGEYAYHIIRNLVVNWLKLRTADNCVPGEGDLLEAWKEWLPELADFIPFYSRVRVQKITGGDFDDEILERTRAFLDAFWLMITRSYERALKVRFVRHGRTSLTDGTFLGRRDPGVTESTRPFPEEWDFVDSSPLRRARETAESVTEGRPIRLDDRLMEIDYGLAEGLTAEQLRKRFPEIGEAWDRGEDRSFPGGECSEDVARRLRSYLRSISTATGRGLVVTHNVVLRSLVADLLGLDRARAHRIPIGHLEPLDVCHIDGQWHADWGSDLKATFVDAYVGCGRDGQ